MNRSELGEVGPGTDDVKQLQLSSTDTGLREDGIQGVRSRPSSPPRRAPRRRRSTQLQRHAGADSTTAPTYGAVCSELALLGRSPGAMRWPCRP
jgi:hypothetical protein